MTTPITTLELALIDVVLRHEVRNVGLDVDSFSGGYARQIWASVLDIYATGAAPSIRAVHDQMLRRGHHRDDQDARRLIFLPLGHLADLEDLVAIVGNAGHHRATRIGRWAA